MKYLALPALLAVLALAACEQNRAPESGEPDAAASAAPDRPAADARQPAETTAAVDEQSLDVQPVEESAGEVRDEAGGERALRLASSGGSKVETGSRFKAGADYRRLTPTQPTVTGADKVEVAEVFWYGCSHCYEFEPYLERWRESKPSDVVFVRLPAVWNRQLRHHAQGYFTAEVLAGSGALEDPEALHKAFFREIHVNRNPLASEADLKKLFARYGVSEQEFDRAWKSFEVDSKLKLADKLSRRYQITGVPTVVVNGKYAFGRGETGGYERVLEIVDELVERERG